MTHLVHSFWTAPSMTDRYGYKCEQLFYNLWYFALSCAYAKRSGAEIVLHTDTLGKLLFGHLPYDKIYTTLDNVDAPPRFWAAGKFFALDAERDGRAIHIDGDVFIKSAKLWERMANSESDLLVQYIEPWLDTRVRDRLAEYMTKKYFVHPCMYNTGVFGIFDTELKQMILDAYFDTIDEAGEQLPDRLLDDPNFTPDLVCEQQMVAYMSQGFDVDFVLSDAYNCKAEANRIGFQHILSTAKYRELDKCKETLREVDKTLYYNTKRICQNI